MSRAWSRRQFLRGAIGAGGALTFLSPPAAGREGAPASDRIRVGVMGMGGRGRSLAKDFASLEGAEVAYVCDVDRRNVEAAIHEATKAARGKPQGVGDFRRILDDRSVDALVIAAPNHWHAAATILACRAGKHVYVEKPCSHTPQEGEWMVAAARKYERVVQVGTQRRTIPGIEKGIAKVRSGAIGRVLYSRAWYANRRGSIGRGTAAAVPEWLDYGLWQGPAPEREYRSNLIHYNWHWFWHWGGGECANNGVHGLDLSRWGLGVDYPRRVAACGGRYHFDDDQETPDTLVVTMDFGDKCIVWEGRSCDPRGMEGMSFGVSFHGEKGTIVLGSKDYWVYDEKGAKVEEYISGWEDAWHIQDFLDCIRSGGRPNADIEDGHKSALLCHLGNIAYRTGGAVETDPATGALKGPAAAAALWSREYRKGWEPQVG